MPDQESPPQGGASELASFGEELRREREIRGISLKEISDATKISKRFLEALERNDHQTLPAPVFTRGFVREYARYVGLNSEDMVNRYNFAASNDDRIEKPPQIERYPVTPVRDITPKPQPKRGIPPAYARVNRNYIYIVLIVLALAGVTWYAVQRKLKSEPDAGTEIPVTTAAKPVALPPAPAPAPAPVVDDSKLRLEIEAVDDSWVQLRGDGKSLFTGDLSRGERKNFEAADKFQFRTGNAAGVVLRLNGIEVPQLGPEGRVREIAFDRAALERLRAGEPSSREQP
ncbi:MAG TPA: RodZ domain-containing protein [Thermoanaerobaculia bacterium]|nr:RodZ domain-containing protein [Thermoanaerobaculia bacterium]